MRFYSSLVVVIKRREKNLRGWVIGLEGFEEVIKGLEFGVLFKESGFYSGVG